jgi:hypothetical protein
MAKLPYRVAKLGGGRRSFAKLESAIAFAASQSRASWAQEDWSVWDTSVDNGEPKYFFGGAPNPIHGLGTCVRLVAADGTNWDPYYATPEVIDR